MKLHFERLQFAGRERLLVFGSLQFLISDALEVLVSMSRHHDCDIHGDLVRKSLVNQFERSVCGSWNIYLQSGVPWWQDDPANARLNNHKRSHTKVVDRQMPKLMPY